ncbi:MAG TPA: hypothetical protein VLW85_25590 [Myxococcales bacterium]|nr:hypothetical protein [Myxococcales bacterium]
MDRELAAERPVAIPHGDGFLTGSFAVPEGVRGAVIVANDAGCARHVPALRALAAELRRSGLATLMVDVAAEGPDEIATRIDSARRWLAYGKLAAIAPVVVGLGEAAPAALLSAAARPSPLQAVVACGPRPDTAGIALEMLDAPVLLVAQSGQLSDIGPHVRALGRLRGKRDMAVLRETPDAIKHAVDIGRAVVAFLNPGQVRHAA